jgi:hypothetical protein
MNDCSASIEPKDPYVHSFIVTQQQILILKLNVTYWNHSWEAKILHHISVLKKNSRNNSLAQIPLLSLLHIFIAYLWFLKTKMSYNTRYH